MISGFRSFLFFHSINLSQISLFIIELCIIYALFTRTFCNNNALISTSSSRPCSRGSFLFLIDRQHDGKRRPFPDLRLYGHTAVMFFDDLIADAQPQPRPLAGGFCRKERIEYFIQDFRRDPLAGIAHVDAHEFVLSIGFDRDGARPLDGVQGVDDQVDEDLPQPLRTAFDGRRAAVIFFEFRLVLDLAGDDGEDAFDDLFDLDAFHYVLILAREGAQVVDDFLDALDPFAVVLQQFWSVADA